MSPVSGSECDVTSVPFVAVSIGLVEASDPVAYSTTLLLDSSVDHFITVLVGVVGVAWIPEITGTVVSGTGDERVVNVMYIELVFFPSTSMEVTRKRYMVAAESPVRVSECAVTRFVFPITFFLIHPDAFDIV